MITYCVHAADDGVVHTGLVLSSNEEAVTLSCRYVDQACLSRVGIDSVNFDNSHIVTFEPEVLSSESTNVDYSEHVCLAGLNRDRKVLSVVHQSSLRNRLGTSWIGLIEEFWNPDLHLVMIPVRQRDDNLLINLVGVWEVGIGDDKGSAKTVRILTLIMGMIPIRSRLVNLD